MPPPPIEPASLVLQQWYHRLRQATLDDAYRWQRHFTPIIRGDALSAEAIARGDIAGNIADELPLTPLEKARLLLFLRSSSYPTVKVCSRRYVATAFDVTNVDAGTILIHGRIARALDDAPRSVGVAFLVIVNMVHELAHAARAYFHGRSPSQACLEDESRAPFYAEVGYEGPPAGRVLSWFPEAGFSLERKVFGGVVGVVFENEHEGMRPAFFECDYERIVYFFLITEDRGVYRLDMDIVERWLDTRVFTPFDTASLKSIDMPSEPHMRTCAMLNSTHLPRRSDGAVVDADEIVGETYSSARPVAVSRSQSKLKKKHPPGLGLNFRRCFRRFFTPRV